MYESVFFTVSGTLRSALISTYGSANDGTERCNVERVAAGMIDVVVKQRAHRGDLPLPGSTVIVRGDLLDPIVLAESAQRNFDVYGFYGISVFADTAEQTWIDLAASRFAKVEWLVLFTAEDLVKSGLELWDTGLAPHYDAVHADRHELVACILGTSHRVVHNPYYQPGR